MKNQEQLKAKELRSQGISIKKIAKELSVSASSVSIWVRDIILTEKQLESLRQDNPIINNQHRGAGGRKEKAYQERLKAQELGKLKAKEGNLLHMAGCMLYWAEGAKDRNTCGFSNSDPNMLRMFKSFLKNCYNITNEQLRIHIVCHTNNGLTVEDIEKYWSEELDLPRSCFTKTTTNVLSTYSQQKKAKNKLPYGTIAMRVHSYKLVQNIYGAIQEYAGFYNNYMLL